MRSKSYSRFLSLPARHRALIFGGSVITVLLWILPFVTDFDGAEGPALIAFFGRFHIVVLHLPIGWLALVPLLEFIGARWQSANVQAAAGIVLLLGAISAALAATLGFCLAAADGYAGSLVTTHMWLGIATTTTAIVALLLRELRTVTRIPTYAYGTMLAASLVAVAVGGHLGGTLAQGEGYLTARLPEQIKRVLNIPTDEAIPIDYDAEIYAAIVQPILKGSCYTCHNDQKFKGKFSMATHASLLQGGKSKKAAVIPGEHEKSELYRRVTLARNAEKAMPPEEQDPLPQSEITLLSWWIDLGAPSDRSINDLEPEEFPVKIANIVDDLIEAADDLAADLLAFDPEIIAREAAWLKAEYGLDVYPLSQNPSDGLRIETLNRTRPFDENTLLALLPIAEHVRSMDIGGGRFDDDEFAAIASFTHLDQLTLEHSNLAAGELRYLIGLKLRSLNLYGTALGDEGLQYLAQLRSLRRLYLGETGVSIGGVERLNDALPRCRISMPSFELAAEAARLGSKAEQAR